MDEHDTMTGHAGAVIRAHLDFLSGEIARLTALRNEVRAAWEAWDLDELERLEVLDPGLRDAVDDERGEVF